MPHGAIDAGATCRAIEGGAGVARAGDQHGGGGGRFVARFWPVAYRYLEEAQTAAPAPAITAGSVTITLKLPSTLGEELRAYAASSGLSLSETVRRAISSYLSAARGHG
jgi:hypothetical protein